MSVYAIKVWLSKSEKDWFLYKDLEDHVVHTWSRNCLLYTSPSPRDLSTSRMPSSA